MAEVRIAQEGSLQWVQQSGTGTTWATASAPTSGVFGFVRSFSFTSGATIQQIADRGRPSHNKTVSFQPIQVTVNVDWTGFQISAASGSGASTPMIMLEYRASAAETPTTGRYFQFMGVPVNNIQYTENENADTQQYTFNALAMIGPTGTGYLS